MTTNEPWNRIIELDAKGEPAGCFICNKPCYVGLSLPEHDSSSGTFSTYVKSIKLIPSY